MQNRYVGDTGDFGKYGLLNSLCTDVTRTGATLKLGVVWYLVPDESHNLDGKHIKYLESTARNYKEFRSCDPNIYDGLAEVIKGNKRDIKSISQHEILPVGTVYYNNFLYSNLSKRDNWLRGALEVTQNCDLVFLDPDNGLEVGVKKHHKKGPKYVFFDEISPYIKRNQTLVIYHHIGRSGTAEEQIKRRSAQLKDKVANCDEVFSLRYHRGTSRVFFVIPSRKHQVLIEKRIKQFLSGPWGKHFT